MVFEKSFLINSLLLSLRFSFVGANLLSKEKETPSSCQGRAPEGGLFREGGFCTLMSVLFAINLASCVMEECLDGALQQKVKKRDKIT